MPQLLGAFATRIGGRVDHEQHAVGRRHRGARAARALGLDCVAACAQPRGVDCVQRHAVDEAPLAQQVGGRARDVVLRISSCVFAVC